MRRPRAAFGRRVTVVLGAAFLAGCGPSSEGAGTGASYAAGDTLRVRMTGSEFEWTVRYPGPDGAFETADDRLTIRDVHAPRGAPVALLLRSKDYVYTMALPHLDLKEIAVPDLAFSLQFLADKAGEYQLKGDQLCGYSHPDLIGTLVVEEPTAFDGWLRSLPDGRSPGQADR